MKRRIQIQDSSGGSVHATEVPPDVPVEELLPALITKLNMPSVGPDGRLIEYRLYHQERPLRRGQTLDSAGVLDDAMLTIIKEAVFACFLAGTQNTLADKTTSRIENIKPGDRVLSYDAERESFEAGTVKSLLIDRASKYLVINRTLRVTEPHLLYADGEWRPARDILVGNVITTQSGQRAEVSSIRIEDEQCPVYNLHLASRSHTFFAEGILVHNADEKLAYDTDRGLLTDGADFSIQFDPSFSPDDVKAVLTALADYYRACGGAGLELDFDLREASVKEPIHA